MKVVACIFARGGSKGIPGKNLQDLGGKPLIAHAIACGHSLSEVEDLIVSTDDPEIADVAKQFGARIPFLRPPELASDEAPERDAWRHAVQFLQSEGQDFDCLLSLPATAPLRLPSDVQKVLAEFTKPDTDLVVTGSPARRSPFFNMLKIEPTGYASLLQTPKTVVRRQDAPAAFDMTTVAYAASPDFVLSSTALLEGKVRMVEVPVERAMDIDEPLDLEIVRFLYAYREGSNR